MRYSSYHFINLLFFDGRRTSPLLRCKSFRVQLLEFLKPHLLKRLQ